MNRNLLILLAFVLIPSLLFAQHETTENTQQESKNFIGLFVGNSIVYPSKFNLPTLGLEYVREINHHFGIGLIGEVELGSHIVMKNEDGQMVSEVKREGAVLVLPSAFIKIYKDLIFNIGYGIEFEANENLGLLKLGLEYKLSLNNENWVVLPNVSWDHTEFFDGLVYGVSFVYQF